MKQKTLKLLVFSLVMLISVAFVPAGGAFAQTSTSTTNTSTTTDDNISTTTDNNISTTTDNTATTTENTATTTNSVATTTYKVRVMEHLCNNTNDLGQFQNIGTSTSALAMFLRQEFACPTSNLPGDSIPAGSISNSGVWFNFEVKSDDATSTKNVQSDGIFVPATLCESNVNDDFNQSGSIASTTCLNASYYEVPIVATGTKITVTQTVVPLGYHFGAVLFTPNEIMANDDMNSLVSSSSATGTLPMWNFDLATDTDNTIMLHVFAFKDVSTSTATTTPPPSGNGNGTSTATTTPDLNQILNILNDLQSKINNLIGQLITLINKIDNMQSNNGGGSSNGTTSPPIMDSVAHVRAGSYSAVIGDTDDFAGDHFGPFEQVSMSLDGQLIKTMNTDKEGNFSTGSIYLPLTIGYKDYVFKGLTSGKVATATISVLPIP